MNEGTLRIPDWAQFQHQSIDHEAKANKRQTNKSHPTCISQVLHSRTGKITGFVIPAWSCEQTKLANSMFAEAKQVERVSKKTFGTDTGNYRHMRFFPKPVELCPHSYTSKHHLHCAEQPESPSNVTKYCAWHEKRLSWLILVTCETSFTIRRATGLPLQRHQIRRMPQKMSLTIDNHRDI